MVAALWGCVSHGPVIPLADTAKLAAQTTNVLIDDRRKPEERTTRGRAFPCEHWLGDDRFEPDKVTHLARLLSARVPSGAEARVTLTVFDTIEICEYSARRAGAAGVASMGVYMGSGPADGDRVQLQIDGEINGRAFSINRWFGYGDLHTSGAPSEHATYLDRLRALLERCADEIVATGFPPR